MSEKHKLCCTNNVKYRSELFKNINVKFLELPNLQGYKEIGQNNVMQHTGLDLRPERLINDLTGKTIFS